MDEQKLRKILQEELRGLVTKDDLKSELKGFVTKEDLKQTEKRLEEKIETEVEDLALMITTVIEGFDKKADKEEVNDLSQRITRLESN